MEKVIEQVSLEIENLRREEIQKEMYWIESRNELEAFGYEHGCSLANKRQQRQDINKQLQQTGNLRITGGNREGLLTTKEILSNDINILVRQRVAIEKRKQKRKQEWDTVKVSLWKAETKKGISKPLKSLVELVLFAHGIDPGAYHGGDLVGNHCRILLQKSDVIFAEIVTVLNDFGRAHNKNEYSIQCATMRASATASTLTLFDHLFLLMSTTASAVTDELLEQVHTTADRAGQAWLALKDGNDNMPPKIHLVGDHLFDLMIHYHGIGDFDESFVERNHQIGKALNVRSRSMRDHRAKALCHSRWEEIQMRQDVQQFKVEHKKETQKRAKRKAGSACKTEATKKDDRDEKRLKVVDEFHPEKLKSSRELLVETLLPSRENHNS